MKLSVLLAVFSPLLGSVVAGLGSTRLTVRQATFATLLPLSVSLVAAFEVNREVFALGERFYQVLYTWGICEPFRFEMGFMIDPLSALMMLTVVLVSWVVHFYSIGYMRQDPGYARFFSYMSLFTFSMLLLVSANNFLQLFLGWEGVGLVSYLLIGFWFQKDSASIAGFKAFLVNRVGDMGFILGIAAVFTFLGSLDYQTVFDKAPQLVGTTLHILPNVSWSALTVIGIFLFVGAMGKSAQLPLHVWLPDSMEGPTPISALIHAATMVTAGVFMVARLAPLYSLSPTALSVVLVVGATTALLTGLLAFVEIDIKRVIAFSTMSQLGYMMCAVGVGAFSVGIFHLITHAFFKSLLFLTAGSVIVALHHQQDIRQMGYLKLKLPWVCAAFLVGALSLAGIPPFAGFYSKDLLVDIIQQADTSLASYAYWCLLLGTFVTGFYIFRLYFKVFSGSRLSKPAASITLKTVDRIPWVMQTACFLLVLPALFLGMWYMQKFFLDKHTWTTIFFGQELVVRKVLEKTPNTTAWTVEAFKNPLVWCSMGGMFVAWVIFVQFPKIMTPLQRGLSLFQRLLIHQYGLNALNQLVFVRGVRALSRFFYQVIDVKILDSAVVDGSGKNATRLARLMRRMQSGYLYVYGLIMTVGLLIFIIYFVFIQ